MQKEKKEEGEERPDASIKLPTGQRRQKTTRDRQKNLSEFK